MFNIYLTSSPKSLKTRSDKQLGDSVCGLLQLLKHIIIYRNFMQIFCIYKIHSFWEHKAPHFPKENKTKQNKTNPW